MQAAARGSVDRWGPPRLGGPALYDRYLNLQFGSVVGAELSGIVILLSSGIWSKGIRFRQKQYAIRVDAQLMSATGSKLANGEFV